MSYRGPHILICKGYDILSIYIKGFDYKVLRKDIDLDPVKVDLRSWKNKFIPYIYTIELVDVDCYDLDEIEEAHNLKLNKIIKQGIRYQEDNVVYYVVPKELSIRE